jgi:hypothetical protein
MIRVIMAWLRAMRPWSQLDDAPMGYVHGRPQAYNGKGIGRWLI